VGDTIEQLVGVLNGAVGDYLKRTANGLATPMTLARDGRPLAPEGIARAYPAPTSRVVVLVHGLMSTEVVWRMPGGEDYGSLLAKDLGYTPLYLRFNSGLHISDNGEALDALLEEVVAGYPVPITEIVLLGHSMGGLVMRSACHAAAVCGEARRWLALARRAIYVGSPHQGAPLERFGNAVAWALGNIPNPYTQLVADIVNARSHGIKDLRYGSLRREDWEGADADALLQDRRHPVPLLPHIRHHLVVGTLMGDPDLPILFGDGLVPVGSARGSSIFPQEHVRVLPRFDHLSLAHHPEVYAAVRAFCEEELPWSAGAV
jgi:triacylglycerol lipase